MTALPQDSASEKDSAARRRTPRHVIRRLRSLIPRRSELIGWRIAEGITDAQAMMLEGVINRARVDAIEYISTLPNVRVERDPTFPDVSTRYWDEHSQQWVILLRDGDPIALHRYRIAHEFKRILDHGHEFALYDERDPHGYVQAEMAADQFAARILLPAAPLRAHLVHGATVTELAAQFNTPPGLVVQRLADLEFLINTPDLERREP